MQLSKNQTIRKHCQRFYGQIMQAGTVKVPVKQGVLVGLECRLPNGLQYQSFLGVPYAVPPLGPLRFKSPVPLEKFDVPELDCRKEGEVAYQRDPFTASVVGSENCLFLNVYAPKTQHAGAQPLPVMVWIHGGGYAFGSASSETYFPAQLMSEQVIVVSMHYRLGAFGFLYLPEAGIYGNAGLKDQRLALQWVQENIASFNGDPHNVTIFGESAGGAAVHLHAHSRHANKLFHKAIMQSGMATMNWAFQRQPAYKTRRLAELLGYDDAGAASNKRALLEFLQSAEVTPAKIQSVSLKTLTGDERKRYAPFSFTPVIEDDFSPDSIIDEPLFNVLTQPDRLAGMPLLLGHNTAEGLALFASVLPYITQVGKDLERYVPSDLACIEKAPAIAGKLREFYFGGKTINEQHQDELVALLSDYHFNMPLIKAIELLLEHQRSSPVYFYQYDYVGDRRTFKQMFNFEQLRGACHGDELFYLFQSASDEAPLTARDAQMSQLLCRMWANFARSGNPSTEICAWTPCSRRNGDDLQLDYLYIGDKIEMRCNPDAERVKFWRTLYESYKLMKSKL